MQLEKLTITISESKKELAKLFNEIEEHKEDGIKLISPNKINILRNYETGEWDVRLWAPTGANAKKMIQIIREFVAKYHVIEDDDIYHEVFNIQIIQNN